LANRTHLNEDGSPGSDRLCDEVIVRLAQAGDAEALLDLIDRYREFVLLKTRSYFLVGADREDVIQEGMIGLFKAVRDYRNDRDTSFRAFAEICITRQIIEGRSCQEIAVDLDRHVKSIDNALQRIKRKVEQHLRDREYLAREAVRKASELPA